MQPQDGFQIPAGNIDGGAGPVGGHGCARQTFSLRRVVATRLIDRDVEIPGQGLLPNPTGCVCHNGSDAAPTATNVQSTGNHGNDVTLLVKGRSSTVSFAGIQARTAEGNF